ncbi:DNA-binding transcriptional regulator, MerR family [Massilia sp. PDC64]|nr:MerR family transcriptional regulator [Massilia sp. PDC64]SDC71024.1 DNA-binding transcriptional regulator, MerR family [Massilia sp. PDC64]
MRIGELSRLTNVSERMLRYYEQEGLLKPTRSKAGYRLYSQTDLETVRNLQKLTTSGIKLKTAKALLPCMYGDEPQFVPCPIVQEALRNELDALDERLAALQESRKAVARYLGSVAGRTSPERQARG